MTRLLAFALVLTLPPLAHAADDALDEVNAARARRGLPPFARDPGLTAAAVAAADYRATYRIAGHVSGGMGDFAFLPPGCTADAAGCGALEPSWGWGSCCTYESYQAAGAAVTMGADGKRYMHLFVRRGPVMSFQPAVVQPAGGTVTAAQPAGAEYTVGYTPAAQPTWTTPTYPMVSQPAWVYPSQPSYRRGFRR